MAKRSVLHMLNPMPHNSPFDINMAVDAGFDILMPYDNVKIEDVHGLTQDAIFSRGPSGVKQTAMYIGGRNLRLATDMLNICKQAMVPPFQVSVLADPSGAFTTAAALVACVEKILNEKHQKELQGCRAIVFGGTGPVGIATGIIAATAGAEITLVDHLSIETAMDLAEEYNNLYALKMRGTYASSDADKARLLADTDIVFCTSKAGIQVLSAGVLDDAKQLKVAGDVNAVPPLGIEGVGLKDFGKPLIHATGSAGAVGVGALSIGNIKYQLQHNLLKLLLETEEPLFLDFRDAFTRARSIFDQQT